MKVLLLGLAAVIAVLLLAGDPEQHAQRGAGRAQLGQLGSRTDPPVRPAPPARYRVPRHAIRVSSSRELRAALAGHRRRAIVLAAGE